MSRELISEEIHPVAETQPVRPAAAGEPVLPRAFTWRDREYEIADVLQTWKESGPCTSGSNEVYLRKHWYHIRTATGEHMRMYFDRQARRGSKPRARWWLYSVESE